MARRGRTPTIMVNDSPMIKKSRATTGGGGVHRNSTVLTTSHKHIPSRSESRTTTKIKPIFSSVQLICITASTLGIAMDWSKFIVCGFVLGTGADIWPSEVNPYYAMADFLYYTGSISFYVMAFLKPYQAFKGSKYEVSRAVFWFYVIFISISAVTAVWYTFAVIYFVRFKSDPQPSFFRYDIPAMIILTSNDLILNTSLMILFVSRLKSCLLEISACSDDLRMIDKMQKKWGDLITKHAVLFTLSIITNQLFLLSIIYSFATTHSFGWYWTSFRGTENLANVVVLYLAFAANHSKYQAICGRCHLCVKNCFVRTEHYQLMPPQNEATGRLAPDVSDNVGSKTASSTDIKL